MEFTTEQKDYLSRSYEILKEMEEKLSSPGLTGCISQEVISQLLAQNQAAAEWSRSFLPLAATLPLRRTAVRVIQARELGLRELNQTQGSCAEVLSTQQELSLYTRRFRYISRKLLEGMEPLGSRDLSGDYLRGMALLCESTVLTVENALNYPLCPGLPSVLRDISDSCLEQEGRLRRLRRI